jgi:hypothetical protein
MNMINKPIKMSTVQNRGHFNWGNEQALQTEPPLYTDFQDKHGFFLFHLCLS